MEIIVRKPTQAERKHMLTQPTWQCGVSKFDWHYDSTETCMLTAGQVTLTHDGGSISFGEGDYVTLPRGLSCVWDVTVSVKKHYIFE